MSLYESINPYDTLLTNPSPANASQGFDFSFQPSHSQYHRQSRPVRQEHRHTSGSVEPRHFTHLSFNFASKDIQFINVSPVQHNDVPLKVLVLNCQSIVKKKDSHATLCQTIKAEKSSGQNHGLPLTILTPKYFQRTIKVLERIVKMRRWRILYPCKWPVLGDASWWPVHLRQLRVAVGSDQPTECKRPVCGMHVETTILDSSDYLSNLETCLSRIQRTAHIELGGDFNLKGINLENHCNRQPEDNFIYTTHKHSKLCLPGATGQEPNPHKKGDKEHLGPVLFMQPDPSKQRIGYTRHCLSWRCLCRSES